MDRRRQERVAVALPVTLKEGRGIARNVSGSGVYFECSSRPANLIPGAVINFFLELDDPRGGALRLNKVSAQGEILRVEPQAGKVGVAAAIKAYKFEPEKLGDQSTKRQD